MQGGRKIAVSGKGGVGKSTLAGALALLMARRGQKVLAIDADPDANLASALGLSHAQQCRIVPIAQQKALVEERTGAKVKQYGQMFKINPEVGDIAEKFAFVKDGVSLLVLGAVESGGGGCACPESVLLRALVQDVVLHKNESLVMDMEAGVEHLGRATARGVDVLVVVVEPGQRSIDCAHRVRRMAGEIGITDVRAVANKIASADDERFVREGLADLPLVGSIPFSQDILASDRDGRSVLDSMSADLLQRFEDILKGVQT